MQRNRYNHSAGSKNFLDGISMIIPKMQTGCKRDLLNLREKIIRKSSHFRIIGRRLEANGVSIIFITS